MSIINQVFCLFHHIIICPFIIILLLLLRLTHAHAHAHVVMLNHLLLSLSKVLAIPFKRDLDDHDHDDDHEVSTIHGDEDSPSHDGDQHEEYQPNSISASLVPIPAYFFAESVKQQLPAMPYGSFLEKNGGEVHDDEHNKGCVCIICLNMIEGSHEVRVPFNCCHVFHRECLDAWVDQGHGTCPLCRSKLLPTHNHHLHRDNNDYHDHDSDDQAGDPWRRERMIYLFGDDFLFGDD